MKIVLKTLIRRNFETVVDGFNRDLFTYLLPPSLIAKLVRYDGQQRGDFIHLRFRLPFINDWKVVIKEVQHTDKEYRFVDRGLKMPFGLIYWQHVHRVVSLGKDRCVIVDEMEYESSWILQDLINYVLLYLAFFPRKFLYKKYFEKDQAGKPIRNMV